MRISTKGRYGTRAMLTLAGRYGQGLTSAGQIAADQDIPIRYLENLLGVLRSAGLVNSERGKRGGYLLARPPSEITLHDVLSPLEESLDVVHCTAAEDSCERTSICATRQVWMELKEATDRILNRTTLADLVQRVEAMDKIRQGTPGAQI
jgi:Rrf2 family cysteine metabolism transcriptional repressor